MTCKIFEDKNINKNIYKIIKSKDPDSGTYDVLKAFKKT
jgi:hypothetical protein